jgi:hypothetical protein
LKKKKKKKNAIFLGTLWDPFRTLLGPFWKHFGYDAQNGLMSRMVC